MAQKLIIKEGLTKQQAKAKNTGKGRDVQRLIWRDTGEGELSSSDAGDMIEDT